VKNTKTPDEAKTSQNTKPTERKKKQENELPQAAVMCM